MCSNEQKDNKKASGLAHPDALREQFKLADGVIICTPEYARGVPGVLKNALDWIVSSGEFENKSVAVISASSRIAQKCEAISKEPGAGNPHAGFRGGLSEAPNGRPFYPESGANYPSYSISSFMSLKIF